MFKKFFRFIAAVLVGVSFFYSPHPSMDRVSLFETCMDGLSQLVSYIDTIELPTFSTESTLPESSDNYKTVLHLSNRSHLTSDPYLNGIDVSSFNGIIDWQAVADSGVDFAIIRVGAGISITDNQFLYNLQGAKDAGLLVGIYHYSHATTPERAQEEANFVLTMLNGAELDLPVFYDLEFVKDDSISPTDCARSFCQTIETAGYQAGIYFSAYFGETYYNLQSLSAYPFWLAFWYAAAPSFDCGIACWQYTGAGNVPGIAGEVDLNRLWLPQ